MYDADMRLSDLAYIPIGRCRRSDPIIHLCSTSSKLDYALWEGVDVLV